MVTAFVLSGGGSLGAAQVGALRALSERGIHPDQLIGVSAGSLNAAFVAGRGDGVDALRDLAALWTGLRRTDVFPIRPVRAALAAAGRRSSLCASEPLASLLRAHLNFTRFEESGIPLHVVTTDVLAGSEVIISEGTVVDALLASCAIPGIFAAQPREGRLLCDGALAYHSGISEAVALGADIVYLLPAGTACALETAPRHPVAAALHAVTLLLQQRALLETRIFESKVDLRVLPPLCPLAVSSADFSQAASLIARAYESACGWLDSSSDRQPGQDRFLSLHHHGRDPLPG